MPIQIFFLFPMFALFILNIWNIEALRQAPYDLPAAYYVIGTAFLLYYLLDLFYIKYDLPDGKGRILILILFCLIAIYFYADFSILKHKNYQTSTFDLGLYDNMYFHLIREFNSYTDFQYKFHITELHFSWIFLSLVPFYYLFPFPETLLTCQSMLLVAGIFPIYALSRHYTKNNILSYSICLLYLLYPALQGVNSYHFHELAFFPVLFLTTMWFYVNKRINLFYLFLILTLGVKEDVSIYCVFLGLYLIIEEKDTKNGIIVTIFCLVYFIVVTNFILPATYIDRFKGLMATGHEGMSGLIITLITNPLFVFKFNAFDPNKIFFWFQILLPVLFLPIFSKWNILLLIGASIISLFSDYGPQSHIDYQYVAVIIPSIFFLTIKVISKIKIDPTKLTIIIIYMAVCTNELWGKMGLYEIDYYTLLHNGYFSKVTNNIDTALDIIPENSSVASTSNITPHLSNRYKSSELGWNNDSDYLIADTKYTFTWPLTKNEVKSIIEKQIFEGNYGIIYYSDGIFVLRKNASKANNFILSSDVYNASNLPNSVDTLTLDTLSISRKVLTAFPGIDLKGNAVHWGPYVDLDTGNYVVQFSLRLKHALNNNFPVATVDVYSNGKILASKVIKNSDLNSNSYSFIKLPFKVQSDKAWRSEFRIWYNNIGELYSDVIVLNKN